MPNDLVMDGSGVAVQQSYRLLLIVVGVIAAAIAAAIGLFVWSAHSTTRERRRALDQAIGPLASAMPPDARPVKNVARSDYRLRTYHIATDVRTAETEVAESFRRTGLNPSEAPVSPAGDTSIAVAVPHATNVNVDLVRLRADASGTAVELFVHIED